MGLMQLLTVGRSLSEARDRPHRFKLLNGAMPTFGHSKIELQPECEGKAGVELKTDSGEQAMKTETTQATVNAENASGINAYPLGRWTLKANPFKASSRPAGQPVVQGELSLEKVKVVRNDLSDSDLELVAPGKPVGAATDGGVCGLAQIKRVKLPFWSRVKARLFRIKAE